MSIHRNIIRLTLVALTLSLSLAVLASKPPAQPKEGFGVFLVVLSQTAAGAGADDGKLDLAAYGGTLHEERDNVLVVTLPLEAWPRVESHSRVSYVQRVWMGEPREQWEAQRRTERRPRAATQSMESLPEAASWDSATYAYDGSGNITAIGDDQYSYDTAGRIAQASVDGVPEQYGYDAFGNLTSKRTNGNPSPIPPIDPSSNRLIGYPYDEAGNVTSLPGNGGAWEHASSYMYDSLGMPVLVQGHTERSPHRMIYTADDERLALMNIGNDAQIWVRGFDGKVLREYRGNLLAGVWTWKQDYIWAGGQLVSAERQDVNGGRLHFHLDHLGSVRLITKSDQTRLSSHEFFPFGVERTDSVSEVRNFDIENNRVEPMKFTGHERDFYGWRNVDGTDYLDYMHARYYDANMGRFLSVDPTWESADLGKPQTWNRYAYVMNNPVNLTDPDGKCPLCVDVLFEVLDGSGPAFEEGMSRDAASPPRTQAEFDQRVRDGRAVRTFQTYTKTNPETGQVYTGRTSGTATPEQNVARRDAGHHKNAEGYNRAQMDKSSTNKDAIRGREQQGIDANGGARSRGGTSGNAIDGISHKNPKKPGYLKQAAREFGDFLLKMIF